MAQTFSLGPVSFSDWSATEKLKLPRRTTMSTHEIPQTDNSPAEKIGQTFGTFADPITLEGTLLGPNADDDLRQLEALQDAQKVVTLTMATRVFDVLIAEIEPEYVSIGEINFTVSLEPLLERRAGASAPPADASAQLTASLDQIDALAPQVQLASIDPSVYQNVQIAQTKRASIGDLSLADVLTQISYAQTLYNALQSVQAQLQTLRSASGVSGTVQMLESLSGALSGAYKTLLTYTGQSPHSPTVKANNTTAYAIAAQYTGDWRNYKAIMAANNLSDPMIVGSLNLTIPRV